MFLEELSNLDKSRWDWPRFMINLNQYFIELLTLESVWVKEVKLVIEIESNSAELGRKSIFYPLEWDYSDVTNKKCNDSDSSLLLNSYNNNEIVQAFNFHAFILINLFPVLQTLLCLYMLRNNSMSSWMHLSVCIQFKRCFTLRSQ